LARIDLKKNAPKEPVDQLTISLEATPAGGGALKMAWEKTEFSAAIKVKK